MPKLEKLNALVGKYVNLEYPLPNGKMIKFLDDKTTYLGNQLESEIVDGICFGILANMKFCMSFSREKYVIDEPITVGVDIYQHPRTTMDENAEFLTKRPLEVKMICEL